MSHLGACVDGERSSAKRLRPELTEPYGLGEEISIRGLAGLVAELTGYEGGIVWDTTKPNGQPRRTFDVTRAMERFGFHAPTPLREGIKRTVPWNRAEMPTQAAR